MGDINVSQIKQRFTQELIATYRERAVPTSFLQSFYNVVEKQTRYLTFEVKKYDESVAIDIVRGTEGNMNKVSLEDNKIIDPPVYSELLPINQLSSYETSWGIGNYSAVGTAMLMEEAISELGILQDKIARRKELQCAQILDTGIVTLSAGTNIDFKRKTQLLNTDLGSGAYWDTNATTATPDKDVSALFEKIRTLGKAQGGNANIIFGERAWLGFQNTDYTKTRSKMLNTKLDDLRPQLRNNLGASYKGRADFGSWTADLWTYPEFYKDANGAMQPYINTRDIHVLPDNPYFVMGHAGLPTLPDDGLGLMAGAARAKKSGSYVINEYLDRLKKAWLLEIASCFCAMPVQINGFAKARVVSAG